MSENKIQQFADIVHSINIKTFNHLLDVVTEFPFGAQCIHSSVISMLPELNDWKVRLRQVSNRKALSLLSIINDTENHIKFLGDTIREKEDFNPSSLQWAGQIVYDLTKLCATAWAIEMSLVRHEGGDKNANAKRHK